MENNQNTDQTYVSRFNDGYIIAKYMPELSEQLSTGKSNSPAFLAMQDGRKQYLMEQSRERMPYWLKMDASKRSSRSFARDKGKTNNRDR